RDDPTLIPDALEELLRYCGSIFMLSRRATVDIELSGVTIHANDYVFGFVHAGHRDPTVFVNPDRLDVSRTGVKSLSFGHGIHYCVGAALARLQATVVLSSVLARLPKLSLNADSL